MTKISNFKFQISNSQMGFTLIELVVSLMVLVTVGSIVISILFSSLRGTNKTNTVAMVSQNGSYAINQMAKMIQGAQSLSGVSTDGTDFAANCVPVAVPSLTPTPTPAQYKAVKITSFDGGQTTFVCCDAGSLPATIASNSGSLTCSSSNRGSLLNTNSVRLEPSSCYFMCSQSTALDYPVVQINFSLREAWPSGTPPAVSEKTASASAIPFTTSVKVRNR